MRYLLAESIEEDDSRLEIEKEIAADALDFPFLLELEISSPEHELCDETTRGDDWFSIDQRVKVKSARCDRVTFDLKYPENFEEISNKQGDNIVDTISSLYEKAENGADLADLGIDIDSFVDYYLFQELFVNDGFGHSSTYLYRNSKGLIVAGPIWDFDMYMTKTTSTGFNEPELYDSVIFRYLMKNAEFESLIKERFMEVKEQIMPLVKTQINALRENSTLLAAISKDQRIHNTWGAKLENLKAYQNDNIVALTSFSAHIDYILGWMWDGMDIKHWWSDGKTVFYAGRLDWLEENLDSWADV